MKEYAPERFADVGKHEYEDGGGLFKNHIRERLQEDGILTQNTLETLLQSVVSNPLEEENDLASVETDDDFIPRKPRFRQFASVMLWVI